MVIKRVEVAAGIVFDDQGKLLLAKRAQQQHQGNKWEFPGGKIESHETPEQALCRELKEEIGIEVALGDCQPFQRQLFDYPDKHVSLHFFCIHKFFGEAQGLEGQPLAWVRREDCINYPLPEANQSVMLALQRAWPD